MKRIFSLFLVFLLLLGLSIPTAAFSDPIHDIRLDSQGVYLLNLETDTALYTKNSDARMYPASTTKIMTALIVLEECENPKLTTVTVPNTALFDAIVEDGGVHMEMSAGETFTVYDLLLGMMVSSYCDCAELLAYHFGGNSVAGFVEKMNERAAQMGLENTHFENAHGLHHNNHYSSPHDIAHILSLASRNETFVEIISTRNYTIPATLQHKERPLRYTVAMFYSTNSYYTPQIVGGKSGFTDQAGRCLATYSKTQDASYILVLLGANLDPGTTYNGNATYSDTNLLINYAYENFSVQTLYEKGDEVSLIVVEDSEATVKVVTQNDIKVLRRNGAEPQTIVEIPESISAEEVENGKKIGTLSESFDDRLAVTCDLVLEHDGSEIHVKSAVEKEAEKFGAAVTGIFRQDSVFVTLLLLLILVIATVIPLHLLLQKAQKKNRRRPKH